MYACNASIEEVEAGHPQLHSNLFPRHSGLYETLSHLTSEEKEEGEEEKVEEEREEGRVVPKKNQEGRGDGNQG